MRGEAGSSKPVGFTVDPAHDTPAVLRAYAARYQADTEHWLFLTGPPEEIIPLIVDGFRLGVQALPPTATDNPAADAGSSAPEVLHSGRFVLIDRRGRIRAYYDGTGVDLERIVRDVHRLLR